MRKTTLSIALSTMIASQVGIVSLVVADFYDSPTNYVPTVSDLYVCNNSVGTISVVNGVSGAIIQTITLPVGAKPTGIAFRPNYSAAYVTDNAQGKVYYIVNNQVANTIPTPSTGNSRIALHPQGNFAYISSSVGLLVLDTNPNSPTYQKIVKTIPIDFSGSIVFMPDGSRAYISIDGNWGSLSQVKVVDTRTHAVTGTIQLPKPTAPLGIAATPDGKRLYVGGWVARNVSVIDSDPASPTYNTVTAVIPVSGNARGIALNPAGTLAYVTLEGAGVDVIVTALASARFNQVITHINGNGTASAYGAGTALDGQFMYFTDASSNKLYVVDSEPLSATFNTVKGSFTVGAVPVSVAVKPH